MELTDAERHQLIETAHHLADAARTVTLAFFRSPGLVADSKGTGGFDPVTIADRLAEQRMREILAERRPDDGILGEEFGKQAGTSGLTWVLDPIDGTRAFFAGLPTWGVLIAVGNSDGPVLGIIDQPYIGERFIGGLGIAELQGPRGIVPLRTRPARPLADAILMSTFPEVGTAADGAAFHRVAAAARLTRYGTDCYGYAMVALGQADLVIEAGLQAYDIQAPIAVIEAAGGVVTDWQGRPVHNGGNAVAAANSAIHAEALALLNAG